MSLLNKKVLPTLKDGMYETTVKSFEEIENEQGGYIRVILNLPDREYTYCIFPSQIDYVAGTLRNQLGLSEEEVTLEDVLVKAEVNPIKVWFKYNTEFQRMNVAFHEPKNTTTEAPIEM